MTVSPRKHDSPGAPPSEGMTLGDHIDDLRRAVLRAVIPPVALFMALWPLWDYIHRFTVSSLLSDEHARQLTRLTALDTFSLSIKIASSIAIVTSIPWIVFQLWLFVRPGLYPRERRFGYIAIPLSIGLFLGGVGFAFYFVLPATFDFLMDFGSDSVANNFLGIEYFYDLVFALLFALGVAFQLPLIVAPAIRFRIIPPDFITRHRKALIFAAAILGAVVTPTGDPLTMTMVAAPMYFLIEGGVLLGLFWKKRADRAAAMEPSSIAEGFRQGMAETASEKQEENKGRRDGLLGGQSAERFARLVTDVTRDFTTSLGKDGVDGKDDDDGDDDGPQSPGGGGAPSSGPVPPVVAPPLAVDIASTPSSAQAMAKAPLAATTPGPAPDAGVREQGEGNPARLVEAAPASSVMKSQETSEPAGSNANASAVAAPADEHVASTDPLSGRAVPPLPRELRRRIDAYLAQRLEEMLNEVRGASGEMGKDHGPDEQRPS